jgi:Family of unknown function (DUF6325)
VNSGTIRIIDLVVMRKDEDGTVVAHELDALSPEEAGQFEPLDVDVGGLLSEEDIAYAGAALAPNSSAAVFVWENLRATPLAEAVRAANGVITAYDRLPDAVINAAFQAVSSNEDPAP